MITITLHWIVWIGLVYFCYRGLDSILRRPSNSDGRYKGWMIHHDEESNNWYAIAPGPGNWLSAYNEETLKAKIDTQKVVDHKWN